MRQSEVSRLGGFLLAFLLVLPVAHAGRAMVLAGAFLAEFLSGGSWRPLSWLSDEPRERPMAAAGVEADLYTTSVADPGAAMVLVHGLAPAGKDDPRLREAARLLARAGFDVAVPTIPGLTRARLRPEDREPVIRTLAARAEPTTVLGVSIGAGVAILAAADPEVQDRVSVVLSLGGYASAAELARFYLTGEYGYGLIHGRVAHDPEQIRLVVEANPDLLDASARRLLSAPDPVAVSRSLSALSPKLRTLLDSLSPERVVHDVRARLILVHGRGDVAVPYTETLRLAAARPKDTRVLLVGVVGHVESAGGALAWSELRDALALWSVMYSLIVAA